MPILVPVIDLFAGPGGLGEGFSSYSPVNTDYRPFKIGASVEMDAFAHQTLELRSFFHEFSPTTVPDDYYRYLRQEISREELFKKYPKQAKASRKRAIKAVLGTEDDVYIHKRLSEILSEHQGKPWVLIGGPPCQAYSLIGRSRRQANGKGKEKQQKDIRNFLYKEYLRIIAKFSPSVFVMENVKGILSAQVNGEKIITKIFEDLKSPRKAVSEKKQALNSDLEYNIYSLVTETKEGVDLKPHDYLIQSEKYGIPQSRHRVILLGIRKDLSIQPNILKLKSEKVSVKVVISDLPTLRSSFTKIKDSQKDWYDYLVSMKFQEWFSDYEPIIRNGRIIESHKLTSMMKNAISRLRPNLETGKEFTKSSIKPNYRPDWYFDKRLGGVINHTARGHMKEDLWRYFFCAVYAEMYGFSPRMKDFPKQLLPNHKNVRSAIETGAFGDRFRVQNADNPAATITCHISKDGHYSIHYDPAQCRSLTVREAARLQTFPDNYFFEGPRTQQYHQVGNAVPPLLAIQIADVVFDVIKQLAKIK